MIEGLHNFRDVGGMPLVGGGSTRSGVLFRSDALSALTAAGQDALAATPIDTVVDFRTDTEKRMAPDILPASRPVRVVELSILEGALSGLIEKALRSVGGKLSPAILSMVAEHLPSLGDLYVGMLAHSGSSFATTARLVAGSEGDAGAVLVHCTAGKDRTGVAVALILDAVGVEREAVVGDYASSEANLAGEWADGILAMATGFGMPITPALRELATGTPPAAIEHALAWVQAHHGSAAQYLQAAGLTDDELAALRARLVR